MFAQHNNKMFIRWQIDRKMEIIINNEIGLLEDFFLKAYGLDIGRILR